MADRRSSALVQAVAVTLTATTLRVLATGRVAMFGIDDANIYFTYVKHALLGYGIAFAPDGAPVEGFTSLAWWALLTAAQAVLPFSLDMTSLILSTAVMVALLTLVHRTVSRTDPALALPVILVIAAMPGVVDWLCLSRMETGLWTLAVLGATISVTLTTPLRTSTAIAWLAVLPLIRPEGYALAPLLSLIGGLRLASMQGAPGSVRMVLHRTLTLGTLPVLVIAAVILWRWNTFGVVFPMTYYAKVSASLWDNVTDGWTYLLRSLASGGWVPLLTLAAALLWRRPAETLRWPLVVMAWLVIQPILSGGDHFSYGRFLVPAYLLGWLLLARHAPTLPVMPVRRWAVVGVLIAVQTMAVTTPPWRNALRHEYAIARDGRLEAAMIEAVHATGPLPVWGVTSAGGTSYAYSGTCLDLLGLNNPRMAVARPFKHGTIRNHASFSAEVFFAQAPDVLWVFGAASDADAIAVADAEWRTDGAQRRMLRGLIEDHRFARRYAFGRVSRNGASYYGIVRRAWMDSLPAGSVRFEPLQTRTFVF